MSALKNIAERLVHGAGAMHLVRARRKNQCRILMYHRFRGTPEQVCENLTRQCEHLRQHYQPVSMGQIADALRTGAPLPPNGLAITVDDGYRDLKLALPVFRAFGFPVLVYVVSEFSDARMWLWPDQVEHAFRETSRRDVDVELGPGETKRYTIAECADLEQAMIRIPNTWRLRVLASLPERLNVEIPAEAPPECQALTWAELRAMAAEGLEIGAHTRTHPILSKLETAEMIADEIAGSKARIEQALGMPVRHFCYPNGRPEDYTPAVVEAVRTAGYETAVTTSIALVKAGADAFRLSRLGVEPEYPPFYYERCVAGWNAPA